MIALGMEALEAFNAGRRAIHAVEYEPASFRSAEVTRTEAFAFWKAARAPLEAELTALREITVDARNAMVDALGVGASLMTTAQAIRALNRERIRLEDIVNQQGSDRVGKWEQREAQLATLEAENKRLREQLGKATEMNHRQANDIGGLEGYLGKDGTAFLHTGTPATVEAVRRIEELKAQLAQAQKPAVKSLADMIAESTTLAMGQRTAALETMIREFLKQTGAKVEDCVLVEQMEDTKLTWHIEHRPAPAGLPEVNEEIEVRSDGRPAPGREGGDVMDAELFFAKYDPPPVVYGPWPADGHPFWNAIEAECEKLIGRARVLAAEYFEACSLPPWANRNPGLRELAHAKAIEAAVSGTAKATMGEIFKAALVDLRRKKGNR